MQATQVMLRADSGYLVCDPSGGGAPGLADRCGDGGIWRQHAGGVFTNARTGYELVAGTTEGSQTDPTVGFPSVGGGAGRFMFTVEPAPGELPSVYLDRLRRDGYVLMPNVLTKTESAAVRGAVFDEIQAVEDDRRSIIPRTAGDKRLQHRADLGHGGWRFLQTEPLVLRFHTHPVMLWVLQEFFGTALLRAAHPPVPRVASPGSGPGGWHNDTPYQQLMQRGFPDQGFPEAPLGVQCNVCIDEYSAENGGTMYYPGSHAFGRKPPGREAGTLPQEHEHCRQIAAPAGSVFMYHAATWHRMHDNPSPTARLGLLQSFVPDFTAPTHADSWRSTEAWCDVDEDARRRLGEWLGEEVEPKMVKSFEFSRDGAAMRSLTARGRRECAAMWVGAGAAGVGAAGPRL